MPTRSEPGALRAGLVACGGIAPLALEAAARSSDFEVVAVQDPDPRALAGVAETYGIAVRHRRFADLLSEKLDFLIVNSPNHLHPKQVQRAIAAAIPCLVQKPMAPSLADARAMVSAARDAGVALGVAMFEHSKPLNHQLRQMVLDGWLGAPVLIQALLAHDIYLADPPSEDDWRRDPAKVGGGAFIQLAVHQLNLASWLLDRRVEQVGMLGTRGLTVFDDETDVACALLKGRVAASFAASYATRAEHFALHGTRGSLIVGAEHLLVRGDVPYCGELFAYEEPGRELALPLTELVERSSDLEDRYEIHGRFARWLRRGGSFACRGDVALRDMKVLDAAYRSREEGRFVKLS